MFNDKKYFFLSGFQKSGTSTIHEWLKQVDAITLPDIKETHFFSKKSIYDKGLRWYFENFTISNKTTHIGEIDPSYSLCKKNFLKIKKTFKQTPYFIFIVRKPIDRAYSHYLMSKLRGYEQLSFNASLNKEYERLQADITDFSLINNGYFERSMYHKYIEIFHDIFPDANPLFLKFEDLYDKSSKEKMFIDIINYLNISCDINNINLDIFKNKASTPKSVFLQKLLYNDSLIKNIFKTFLSARIVTKLKLYLSKINMSKIYNSDKQSAIDLVDDKFFLLNDAITKKVELITNLDLSDWYCRK